MMTSQTEALLTRITNHRLPHLDLGPGAVHPMYEGLSILNLPASLARWLGSPLKDRQPLDIHDLDGLAEGATQIVVVLVDAVSLQRFQRWVEGPARSLQTLTTAGWHGALTSVVPSTTCAALTTLWTGASPAEHGVLGYEIFLREFGMVVNMITHAPAVFEGNAGLLYRAGLDPKQFLPVQTLGPHLRNAGVEPHAFLHYTLSRSGLSQMHYTDVEVHPFGGVPDLWIAVRQLCEQPRRGPRLIWVYFGGVDGASHRYGPDAEQPAAEFAHFIRTMMEEFISQLTAPARKSTLLILLSDHGQLTTRKDPHFELRNHPPLADRLHIQPTGENRLAYLYPKPGQMEAVAEYIERTWPNSFSLIPSSHALENHLFGPGSPSPNALDRIGDRLLIAHRDAYLWWWDRENPLIGRHGGVSDEEMLVPLVASRLD